MTYHAPSTCPVCRHDLHITRLRCTHCETELSGDFTPCRFCELEEKHMRFIEAFLRCRGSIKEVEKALGVSYPTVRNMLSQALLALGLGDEAEAKEEKSTQVLDKLASGEISVADALSALGDQTK